ncbi:MAG: hypothetical protein UU81_C0014G0005 [Microgenomates group bacterium GW2011_GWC1_41_8]|uniref:Carbohydrate kinase PfkB domain-containing protein n=1 Tax=Candidatus Roizmanbacteria bacterium GW2011_GWB1_40_7 TaxID=1618482 RepID=A0A0G0TAQ9_9BACT|nr:MAG: hypothetical protein UU14_C0016G0016 [Candidatus Roizmanbacteria bacterium GW2011_GWB1_40_7]KKS23988.1 MAG: hypothetical protein UU81_C0014G0005 [Microgenomates group bacterium GW2011_GWC1_41_8]
MKNIILDCIKQKKTVIGAIHFSPSPGYKQFDSIQKALKRAQFDLDTLIDGGIDAVIFENNYDVPHKTYVKHETTAFMTYLISKLTFKRNIPFGISVLWNDYRAALSIAKVTGADFIRIPAFVDAVITSYGVVEPVAEKARVFRKLIDAENVSIFADVHVKHAEMVNKNKTLKQSILQATKQGADGIIITGKWTGNAPITEDLSLAQNATYLPIVVGSGADTDNINQLFQSADAAIVSTSFKSGERHKNKSNPNLKSFEQRMDRNTIAEFMKKVKDRQLESYISVYSTYATDEIANSKGKTISEQQGGPLFYIEQALANRNMPFRSFYGANAKIKIAVTPQGETGVIVYKPKKNSFINVSQKNKKSRIAIVSTVLNEWNIEEVLKRHDKIIVDVQGYVRDPKNHGKKKIFHEMNNYANNIYCVKGTNEELSYLPKSFLTSQKKRVIIITKGNSGVELFVKGKKYQINVENIILSENTIGAGDYFLGMFAGNISRGNDEIQAAKSAVKATSDFLALNLERSS